MNIPEMIQKLVFGCVGYAANFLSSSGQFARCIALHLEIRREPSSWLASRQSLPRLNLEPWFLHNGRILQTKNLRSRLAKIPTFESFPV
jgi:hypothetical protein